MLLNVSKVLLPVAVAFFIGIAITPLLTHYLYKHKMWKKRSGKVDPSGQAAVCFNQLHANKEVGTPRLGGVIIWGSVLITTLVFWFLPAIFPSALTTKLNFLSRNQTWIPLATMLVASLVGLVDDWLVIKKSAVSDRSGLPFGQRLLVVLLLGTGVALWFFWKLEMEAIAVPFLGKLFLGFGIVPLFLVVLAGLFSSGVIDGLDGLAGGLMAIVFAAYAAIAFSQQQIDLAAFSAVVSGATLAFLWFNIPPARFYMSETGIMGLTATLTTVAFLTDAIVVLPLIALPLVVTSLSVAIQLSAKKFLGRKIFLVAPLHHHFEAMGWPSYKVVMRYWVIGVVTAILGLIIFLIGQ